MNGGLQIKEALPPSIGSLLKLMGSQVDLLLILILNEIKLLLNGAEPMICIKRIPCTSEDWWLSLKKGGVAIWMIGLTSTMMIGVLNESFKDMSLILVVALNLHQHICEGGWRE
uniref:Uncharacterized protein n=1 Tax=Arundo donax TaxID=35708 RepID=A0A0A9H3Z3_ARUDO